VNGTSPEWFEIDPPADVELAIPREPLRYAVHRAAGSHETNQPLLFFIHPQGMRPDSDYVRDKLAPFLAAQGFVVVTVAHHGTFHRSPADVSFLALADWYDRLERNFAIRADGDLQTALTGLARAGVTALPADMLLYRDTGLDYESFGFLSALDYLAVYADLVRRGVGFDRKRVMAYGSSHGGYIAMLLLKLAPGLLSVVIENSGWVEAVDKVLNDAWGDTVRSVGFGGMRLGYRLRSPWMRGDPSHAWHFAPSHRAMRDLTQDHFRRQEGAVLLSFHSTRDELIPIARKRLCWDRLAQVMDVRMTEVGPEDLDGTVFKTSAHGMDASLRRLFDRAMGMLGEVPSCSIDPFAEGLDVQLACADRHYHLSFGRDYRLGCRIA